MCVVYLSGVVYQITSRLSIKLGLAHRRARTGFASENQEI